MANSHYQLIDGSTSKAIPITPSTSLDDLFGVQPNQITRPRAHGAVAYVNRCVDLRSGAISSLPWSLMNGENEVANSEDVGQYTWLKRLPSLLYLMECSLSIVAQSYIHIGANAAGQPLDLSFLAYNTMEPVWSINGIAGYKRQYVINGMSRSERLSADEVIYFRELNYASETEPGQSVVGAGLLDAGVMLNLNQFAATFFERGAVRATVLQVEGHPSPGDRERIESAYKRMMTGFSRWWQATILGKGVTPTIIGDGLDALNNDALSHEKREAIATACGVPHSMVMSNAANYATAEADRLNFYDTTIIPESERIAETLNEQLFDRMGLTFRFTPQELPIYQEDEEQRAQSWAIYVNAGMPASIAAEMLGLTLPSQYDYSDLDTVPATQTITVDAGASVERDALPMRSVQWEIEAATFRKWLGKRSNPDVSKFKASHLTDGEKRDIAQECGVAVDATFPVEWETYP